MQSLAEDGYDLVIGVGFAQGEALATVANEYRHALRDHRRRPVLARGRAENVVGLLFQEEQAGYLAGVLAAEVAKAKGFDTISSGGVKAAGRPFYRRLPGGRRGRRCPGSPS